MEEELIQLRARAFFANQMLIAVVANVVQSGAYSANAARTNIQEVIDQAQRTMAPEHLPEITVIAQAYNQAIDKAAAELGK